MKGNGKPKMVYGFKAYGTIDWFYYKEDMRKYLMDWMMNTEGAELDRAVEALLNLERGITFTNTDR
jgi:hypothetical protein